MARAKAASQTIIATTEASRGGGGQIICLAPCAFVICSLDYSALSLGPERAERAVPFPGKGRG